jgi:hypothetical protein
MAELRNRELGASFIENSEHCIEIISKKNMQLVFKTCLYNATQYEGILKYLLHLV